MQVLARARFDAIIYLLSLVKNGHVFAGLVVAYLKIFLFIYFFDDNLIVR